MKRPSKLRLAVLTLALAGFCLTPTAGKADYYPWGSYYWPSYTSYYPGYSVGYFPGYWDGYYSGAYTGYAPSCGGGCGSCGWSGCGSCSYGCGSCGVGYGSCGSGCGSYGLGCGSCGVGCGSCGTGCGSCSVGGCGSSCCGAGLACGSGCGSGCGSSTGSDCSGSPPSRPNNKKTPPPSGDDNFQPRSSQDYDDAPPPRSKKKTPAETAPGGASLDAPGNDPATPGKFTREKGTDDTKTGTTPAGSDKFTTPVPATKPASGGGSPAEQPFGANKPTGPTPEQPAKKKAPMPNVPGTTGDDEARSGSMASGGRESDVFTNNPALALQEQPTWSYSGSVSKAQRPAAARVASIGSPVPRRIKSPVLEPAVRVVQNIVRN